MEDLIAQQIAHLREEQARLERQLQTHRGGVASAATTAASVWATTTTTLTEEEKARTVAGCTTSTGTPAAPRVGELRDERRVAEIPTNSANNATEAALAKPLSLHERLQELEQLKQKYARQANKAMNGYFATVSDFPGYQAQRAEKLKSAKPFTFQSRELTRPMSIRERRLEEARLQREREEKAWREKQFKATPVPPTTFMNKYDLMVEEWCERKAAAELRARELADMAKEEAAFVRLSAQGLRHTREELMGAVYDPRTGRAVTRSELRRKRAQSADAAAARRARAITQPEDIPLEVRMTLWPAIKEHEQVRRERIKQVAAERKKEADAHFTAAMPLLSSPTPHQLLGLGGATPTTFGIGQPVAPAANPTTTVTPNVTAATAVATGAPVAGGVPGVAPLAPLGVTPPPLPTPIPSVPGAVPVPPLAPVAVTAPLGVPAVPPPPPVPATVPPPTTATAAPTNVPAAVPPAADPAVPESKRRSRSADVRNPHLTFKPKVKPGVPDFATLWALDRAQLLERKQSRPPTTPEPFDITVSTKETVVRGKRVSRAVSQPAVARKQRDASAPRTGTAKAVAPTRPPTASLMGSTTATAAEATTDATPAPGIPRGSSGSVPKGTRAHALRTQAVYAKYIQQAAHMDEASAEDEAFLREAARRRKEVGKRLGDYLTDARTEHEHAIRAKVRALRAAMRENEVAAQARLEEMRARVAQMPPLFAEPTRLNEESKARAEAEQQVVGLLKQSGLDAATIRNILVAPADEDAPTTPVAAAGEGADGAEGTGEAPASVPTADGKENAEATTAAGDKKKESSAASASSRSSSRASSDSKSSSGSSSDSSSDSSRSSSSSSSSGSGGNTSRVAASGAKTPSVSLPVPTPAPVGNSTTSSPSAAKLSVPVPAPVPVVAKSGGGSGDYADESFEDSSSGSDSD